MNTNHTPSALTLTAATMLALSSVACCGGSMAVEDGVVTETRELVTLDGATVTARIEYPESRLLAGDVPVLDIELAPRAPSSPAPRPTQPGERSADALSALRGPGHALSGGDTQPARALEGPLVATERADSCSTHGECGAPKQPAARAPAWMKVTLHGPAADRYTARLVRPGDRPDARLETAAGRR